MENKNGAGFSSSFPADLFGTKEPPPSSAAGTFASIFPPPPKMVGRSSACTEVTGSWQKQPSQAWNTKEGIPAWQQESGSHNIANRDKSSFFQEERMEPCHLSSSLYYGGQDNYSHNTGSYTMLKKDAREDDPSGNNSHGASRGNWWQGSLYY